MNGPFTDKQLRSAGGAAFRLIQAAEEQMKGVSESDINAAIAMVLNIKVDALDTSSSWFGYMMMHYAQGRHDRENHLWYMRHGKAGRGIKSEVKQVKVDKTETPSVQGVTYKGRFELTLTGTNEEGEKISLKVSPVKKIVYSTVAVLLIVLPIGAHLFGII